MTTDITLTDPAVQPYRVMRQVAPYPDILADLVKHLRYRRHMGWEINLFDDLQRDKPGRHTGESRGMTLVVTRCGPDTHHPDRIIAVNHYFEVPAATYNRQSWMWWLFERLGSVDRHERMEDFALLDTEKEAACPTPPGGEEPLVRPYVPCHGPGWDPYLITVERTETDRRTSFRGEISPA
jgi:hypothetical protein